MSKRRSARGDDPEADIGSVLRDVLKRLDPSEQLRAFEVWNFWNDVVGDALSRRAQPSSYRNGVLTVTVAAHAWMQELQFMKDSLRQRLNERLGGELIRDVCFVSGAVDPPPQARPEPQDIDTAGDTRPQVALPDISDPELAAAFQRVLDAHARRKRRKTSGG